MFSAALISKTTALADALNSLPLWGKETALYVLEAPENPNTLPDLCTEEGYDLLLIDASYAGPDTWNAVDRLRQEQDLPVALVGATGSFETARDGIRHGVADYFTEPFSETELKDLLDRIRVPRMLQRKELPLGDLKEELKKLFYSDQEDFHDLAGLLLRQGKFSRVADVAVKEIFDEYEWLDLYLKEEQFLSDEADSQNDHYDRFLDLHELWHALHPAHNETLDTLFQHILFNPESDLRQKSLSTELHVNQSYLSTVFVAQTGIRFVDYITRVKLARAAWLLLNTGLKVGEIAERMDYKDTAYFSKQFKTIYLVTPSEYRIPDTYQLWI